MTDQWPDQTHNVQAGQSENSIQAGHIHGDVTIYAPRRRFSSRRSRITAGIAGAVILVAVGVLVAVNSFGSGNSSATGNSPITTVAQFASPVPEENGSWILPSVLPPSAASGLSRNTVALAAWARSMGGRVAEEGTFLVTVTGTAPDGVTITNIGLKNVERRPPLHGTFLFETGQAETEDAKFKFDLDSNNPYAVIYDNGNADFNKPFSGNQSITLARNESITLGFIVDGVHADYLFDLEYTVVVDGKVTTVIGNGPDGKPFEVAGFAGSPNSAAFMPYFLTPQAYLDQIPDPAQWVYVDPKTFCAQVLQTCAK
ncbi:MAG TPA: hypothetical protein VH352_14660 [Pseudonocardiaceae bacterium]|jgi:hypothetical protein|nr:hypothetical protein [Pseudonocardiaceae bacterium]